MIEIERWYVAHADFKLRDHLDRGDIPDYELLETMVQAVKLEMVELGAETQMPTLNISHWASDRMMEIAIHNYDVLGWRKSDSRMPNRMLKGIIHHLDSRPKRYTFTVNNLLAPIPDYGDEWLAAPVEEAQLLFDNGVCHLLYRRCIPMDEELICCSS